MQEKNIAKAINFSTANALQKILQHPINIIKDPFIKIKSKCQKNINVIDPGEKILLFIGAKKKMIKILQIILIIKNFISKEKNLFIITKKIQKQNSIIISITTKKNPKIR